MLAALRAIRGACAELEDAERLLRFAVEVERAVYEGRVSLPDDLLGLLGPEQPWPGESVEDFRARTRPS